jgi:thioesterase domain-containing protein
VSPIELETYLHDHIPLSRAMAVSVIAIDLQSVLLRAPLAPNINHRETVFGGSASALAILSAWSLLHVRLRAAGVASRLVIQRNTIDYDLPILGEFTASAALEAPQRWEPFLQTLARRGKARIGVNAVLEHSQRVVARFSGEFVALS